MSKVYEVDLDGSTRLMTRVRCVNEDAELQTLLAKNLDLLPGEQISPDDPVRWLMVKREMPVPDPGTGVDRWSIDFLLLDQMAMPTFVECKRYADTRSRREVVGQMLEYAANGNHYWTSAQLREYADSSARARGQELESAIRSLRPEGDLDVLAFFDRAEENLRHGQVRVIFLMEESSFELRSVVDFLNRQMERTEVLLVEVRQYELGGRRVVAPTLFGFTEQARLAKRVVTERASGERKKWNADVFFDDAAARLPADQVQALRFVLAQAPAMGCEISWGSGKDRGSFSLKEPEIARPSFLSVYSDGTLSLNLGFLADGSHGEVLREQLRRFAAERSQLPFKDLAQDYPALRVGQWSSIPNEVVGLVKDALEAARGIVRAANQMAQP